MAITWHVSKIIESQTNRMTEHTHSHTYLSRSPRDGCDQKRLNANTRIVHLLFGKSRIHNIHNTIDRQRCLGNVGAHNDFATGWSACETSAHKRSQCVNAKRSRSVNNRPNTRRTSSARGRSRLKNALLRCWGKSRIERQTFDFTHLISQSLALLNDRSTCVFDFLFTGQK